ncbi:MAG: 50S ribosomal protein L24 [Candidatus Wolfebacteria bacterium GW2011_GWC1_37_10]|uniref:Large ribosomal subunit protein uL24 n=2 Tax=Candidatus Wolfeibacteriota TaxID=1752735 RepID=A0A0G0IGI5_9BACT|nr:MAG: 50S ribosomal protein L24 [Candidatus Wolfebacteria bacterium GW2011_GWC1_37_10]
MNMKIKKGDNVKIITGKDKGKNGKILAVFPVKGRILVEGLNLYKKHVRPKHTGEKGQTVMIPRSIDVSNVGLICPSCNKITRIGHRIEGEKKLRVCKKCGATI